MQDSNRYLLTLIAVNDLYEAMIVSRSSETHRWMKLDKWNEEFPKQTNPNAIFFTPKFV